MGHLLIFGDGTKRTVTLEDIKKNGVPRELKQKEGGLKDIEMHL